MTMSSESNANRENDMTDSATDNDITETVAMPAQNASADVAAADTEVMPNQRADNDVTEAIPASVNSLDMAEAEDDNHTNRDNPANDASTAAETETEDETGAGSEAGTKTWTGAGTEAGGATAKMPRQGGYVPPSNFATGGSAPSGAYVRVPRDVPPQMPKPQPPAGPSKATIVLSLLPLFLGALMLIVGSAFPMVFAPIPGGVDVRSLIAIGIVALGGLLIALAVLLGLASLIHQGAAKWRARRRR